MKINLEAISKKYDKTEAVKDVSLTIYDKEMMALLGPSGCGKSTLLRMIAGLIPVTAGKLFFNDQDVTQLPAQKRNTSMVFQSYALFPHLNVYENIIFGLQIRKLPKAAIQQKTERILTMMELKGMEHRQIQELSGGQRQRVALARALITEPDVLLFDEPLSNLDEKLRVTMRSNLRQIQKNLGITAIYVTHDQEEAMSIADRISVMDRGRIWQTDTPNAVYQQPINEFVADFVGRANFFYGQQGIAQVLGREFVCHDKETLLLRPENIDFAENGMPGMILQKEHLGFSSRYLVLSAGETVMVDTSGNSAASQRKVNDHVYLSFNKENVHCIQKNDEM